MKRTFGTSKLLALVLTLTLMCGMVAIMGSTSIYAAPVTADTSWYNDTATEFTITTAAQLLGISEITKLTDERFEGKTIKIGADIVFNTGDASTWGTTAPENNWKIIPSFNGTLDGQGHTISGLYLKSSESTGAGLIFAAIGATVKNLAITNSYFESTSSSTGVASFVTTVEDYAKGDEKAGNLCTFSNLYSDAILNNKGTKWSGGIVAGFSSRVGEGAVFERCVFAGELTSAGEYAGGILGLGNNLPATFTDCVNMGKITADKTAGGIMSRVGGHTVTMTRCYNVGEVIVSVAEQYGALTANLTRGGNSNYPPDHTKLIIENCYFASDIVNEAIFSIQESVEGREVSVVGEATSVTAQELIGASAAATLAGFDFTNAWVTVDNDYPLPSSVAQMLGLGAATPTTTGGTDTTATTSPTTADPYIIFVAVVMAAVMTVSLVVISRKKVK